MLALSSHSRFVVAAASAVLLLSVEIASASDCEQQAHAWAGRCAERVGLDVRAARCPSQRLILGVGELEVEVTRAGAAPGLIEVNDFALSPIGEYPSWQQAPAGIRRAFDAAVDCVREIGDLPLGDVGPPEPRVAGARALPWLLLLALLGLAILAVTAKPRWRRSLELAGLAGATFAFRMAVLPLALFHQNGQGAMWIEYALHDHAGLEGYGPGYRELFNLAAGASPAHADTAVIVAQAIAGALVPPLVWIIARRVGAHPVVCWAIAAVVAIDPTLGRLAHSESYFAPIVLLVTLACVALMEGAARWPLRSRWSWIGLVTAGLLIAQAARVHPIGWLPAALVPFVLLVHSRWPGWRSALLHAAIATAAIAAVVMLTSAGAMLSVRYDQLGATRVLAWIRPPSPWLLLLLAALGGSIYWLSSRRDAAVRGATVFAAGCIVMVGFNLLRPEHPWVQHAALRIYVPVLAAGVAGMIAALPARRLTPVIAAAVIVVVGAGHSAFRWSSLTRQSTDGLESSWVWSWRDELPDDARLSYLSRAGDRVFGLPIYTQSPRRHRGAMSADDLASTRLPAGSYYYRSSLCATPEGEAACRAVESAHTLELMRARTLPAIASIRWQPIAGDVYIALYRVAPR